MKILEYSDSVIRNNTWDGLLINITVDGEPIDLSDAEARMTFKAGSASGDIMYSIDSAKEIVMNDQGQVLVQPMVIEFPEGLYVADLELKRNNVVKTHFRLFLTVEPTTNVW